MLCIDLCLYIDKNRKNKYTYTWSVTLVIFIFEYLDDSAQFDDSIQFDDGLNSVGVGVPHWMGRRIELSRQIEPSTWIESSK